MDDDDLEVSQAIYYKLSTINHQLSTSNYELQPINYHLPTTNYEHFQKMGRTDTGQRALFLRACML